VFISGVGGQKKIVWKRECPSEERKGGVAKREKATEKKLCQEV